MSEPLNAERMDALRMEARLRTWTLHEPEGPVANALETVSLLDEVEASRAKLAAIRDVCKPRDRCEPSCGWCNEGDCDNAQLRIVVGADALLRILGDTA